MFVCLYIHIDTLKHVITEHLLLLDKEIVPINTNVGLTYLLVGFTRPLHVKTWRFPEELFAEFDEMGTTVTHSPLPFTSPGLGCLVVSVSKKKHCKFCRSPKEVIITEIKAYRLTQSHTKWIFYLI